MIDLKSIDLQRIRGFFRRKPERIGVDIEGGHARAVHLVRGSSGEYQLANFGEANFALEEPTVEQRQEFQIMMNRVGANMQYVAINMEDASLRLRRMVFPEMPDPDLLEAIKWNFREHVEVPIEDYLVGYLPLSSELDKGKMAVVGYGVSRHAVDNYVNKFKSLGFKVTSLEPVASALHASFRLCGKLQDDHCHSCIMFGNRMTHFVIFKGSEMLFSRPLAQVNHEGMVKQIVRDGNLLEDTVRKMIANWVAGKEPDDGLDTVGDAKGKFLATVKHFFSQMVIEIQRSIDAFCILYGLERVESLHISGLGVLYPDLVQHIERSLGIMTAVFNPFTTLVHEDQQTDEIMKQGPLYTVAVGLALP